MKIKYIPLLGCMLLSSNVQASDEVDGAKACEVFNGIFMIANTNAEMQTQFMTMPDQELVGILAQAGAEEAIIDNFLKTRAACNAYRQKIEEKYSK